MQAKDIFSKQCILSTIGVLVILFSTIFAIFWMTIFESILAKEIKLGPKARSYDVWKTPPIPIYFDVYFFNWTNPSNFSEEIFPKPILEQIGPYRFVEFTDKVDIEWNDNRTVSFRKKSTYYYDAENSKGKMNDMITTLNIVALSAGAKALNWNETEQIKVSIGLSLYSQLVYVTKSAKELLFDGYEDDLIEIAREMSDKFGEEVNIPYDKIGWFYPRNGTSDPMGHFNMHTGEDDISQIGKMMNWNYFPKTDYFPDECGLVNESAGEFYPPIKEKTKPITFFSPDMCRSISLDFDGEKSVHGITGYKYSGGKKTVDNGTEYPENKCFSIGQSVPSGVMNVSTCRYGSPVFMSFPHYYAADPYYLNQVEGLRPSSAKHEFYMTLEPMTGIPMDVAARFQINMLIRPVPKVSLYKYAPHMFFPILWFEQKFTMPSNMASEVKTVVAMPVTGYMAIGIIFIIGLILTLWWPLARLINQRGKANMSDENVIKQKGKLYLEASLLPTNGHVEKMAGSKTSNGFNERKAPLAEKEVESELIAQC